MVDGALCWSSKVDLVVDIESPIISMIKVHDHGPLILIETYGLVILTGCYCY